MRRAVPVSVAILCVLVVVVIAVAMRVAPPNPASGQSELSAITETIQAAFLTRGQACMAEHYDDQAQYEAALSQYWSPATPNASRVATLAVLWASEAPTMEPALYAEIVATAQAEYSAGIIDEKTYQYSVDPSEPTPDWIPSESPRVAVQRQRSKCYAKPGYVDFGVASVYDPDFSINGDLATGTVQIAWWAKVTGEGAAQYDRQHDDRYEYVLEKHGSGPWLILREDQTSNLQGP